MEFYHDFICTNECELDGYGFVNEKSRIGQFKTAKKPQKGEILFSQKKKKKKNDWKRKSNFSNYFLKLLNREEKVLEKEVPKDIVRF